MKRDQSSIFPIRLSRIVIATLLMFFSTNASTQAVLPSQTTATFGDWVFRCVRLGENPAARICEILQQVQAAQNGKTTILANIAVGRLGPSKPLLFTVGLPANLTLAAGVGLRINEKALSALKFERCASGLCFASAALTNELTSQLRGAGEGSRIEYQSAAGEPISVPFSLEGFSQALDALLSESKR